MGVARCRAGSGGLEALTGSWVTLLTGLPTGLTLGEGGIAKLGSLGVRAPPGRPPPMAGRRDGGAEGN